MKAVIAEAIEKYGRLDVMFANAGTVGTNKPFGEVDADEFMKVMRTNVLRSAATHHFHHLCPIHRKPFSTNKNEQHS